jgi:peptidase S24-like protein
MQSVRWLEAAFRAGTAPEGTWIALRGASMEPAYADGDALLVTPVSGSHPVGPGEVVVARRGERLVTHRVVDVRDGVVITKGDACRGVDPPLPVGALLGRVVRSRRGESRFRGWRLIKRCISQALHASGGGADGRIRSQESRSSHLNEGREAALRAAADRLAGAV